MGDLTNLARQFLNEQAPQQPGASRDDLIPGCLIYWQSMDGVIRGPAVVRGILEDQGQTWCWFTHNGIEFLLDAQLVVESQSALERTVEDELGRYR
jgi:hypothetical protein